MKRSLPLLALALSAAAIFSTGNVWAQGRGGSAGRGESATPGAPPRQSLPPDAPDPGNPNTPAPRVTRPNDTDVDARPQVPPKDAVPGTPAAASGTTDPVSGPASRRGRIADPYWNDYWKWYDTDYVPYHTRYYGGRTGAAEVEQHRGRAGLGSTERSGPYNRERYLFYERDRRFNPTPHPSGGYNYNLVR
jgi:hypothetical protein